MDKTGIYLVRHGQTAWNRDGIIQGQLDSPLTALGEQQAYAIGHHLAQYLAAYTAELTIESSHLGRAQATAHIIATTMGLSPARIQSNPVLAELHFGDWQGLNKPEIEARWPGELAARERNKWDYRMPDGENYVMLAERAQHWLEQTPTESIHIAVSHQQFSNTARGLYAGLPPQQSLKQRHPQNCYFHLRAGNIQAHCTEAEQTIKD